MHCSLRLSLEMSNQQSALLLLPLVVLCPLIVVCRLQLTLTDSVGRSVL